MSTGSDKTANENGSARPGGSLPDSLATPRTPFRILIVDDHPLVRFALRQVMSVTFGKVVVQEAESGAAALTLVEKQSWDVVILDIVLSGRNGLEVLQDIRALRPSLPVLMLTAHPGSELAVRSLRSGAAGFVHKTASNPELVAAVRKVLDGGQCLSAEVAQEVAIGFGNAGPEPPHKLLSNREYEVLCSIGAGHANKEIAQRLGVSVKSINTYRARILEKLNLKSTAELVRYAIQQGLDTLS